MLVEPLQKAWADGKITQTESRQLARLLLQIRKEAAKREVDQLAAQAVETASQTVQTFDLSRAKLPASGQTSFVLISSAQNNWPNIFASDKGSYDRLRL